MSAARYLTERQAARRLLRLVDGQTPCTLLGRMPSAWMPRPRGLAFDSGYVRAVCREARTLLRGPG
jgi:hypothetical protein